MIPEEIFILSIKYFAVAIKHELIQPKRALRINPIHFVNIPLVTLYCFISASKLRALEGEKYKQASCLFLAASTGSPQDYLLTKTLTKNKALNVLALSPSRQSAGPVVE